MTEVGHKCFFGDAQFVGRSSPLAVAGPAVDVLITNMHDGGPALPLHGVLRLKSLRYARSLCGETHASNQPPREDLDKECRVSLGFTCHPYKRSLSCYRLPCICNLNL